MLFQNHSLLRSGRSLGKRKKKKDAFLSGLFSREQRLAVNVIVELKCKCPFPFFNPLQEIELCFTLAFAWE